MQTDIIIVGGGITGLSTALGLANNTDCKITLLEAKEPALSWGDASIGMRTSAITRASKQWFESLGVWPAILRDRLCAFDEMHVWDGESAGDIHFSGDEIGEPCLGYIIENRVIQRAFWQAIQAQTNRIQLLCPEKWESINCTDVNVSVQLTNGRVITSQLLISADGALSKVRGYLGFNYSERDYGHTAIVANVSVAKPHGKTARQRFEKTGPLALLPMADEHVCSIVWSQQRDEAKRLLALRDEAFNKEITVRFESVLGDVALLSQRVSFPLTCRHAKNYIQERVVLVGDAAHTIHPLAGQGLNLGLADSAVLCDVIKTACDKGRDFSARDTLRRYERKQKAANTAMLASMDGFRLLFGSDNPYVLHARSEGLQLLNQHRFLKNYFVQKALG